jgi:hypothetical protein
MKKKKNLLTIKAYNAQTCTNKTNFNIKTAFYLVLCNSEKNNTLNNLAFYKLLIGWKDLKRNTFNFVYDACYCINFITGAKLNITGYY